ncbi:MAG: V-type ATPase subunit [Candidatus Heimdallarchaeota archaeon]|nr:V-type ATPase subunit [Candidatus Heimdallarchaeota archaeon]
MMIRNAQDYGALNVHMRAQRTEFFSAGTYNLLASASDFDNLRQMLANTKYNDIIGSEMIKKHPDLIEIDRRLVQNFVDQYNQFRKYIPKRAQSFIVADSRSYFLNNVKVILSALHGANRYEEAKGMLLSLTESENVETEYLYKSRDVEDLISRLSNEDLRMALENALGEYKFLNLIYPLIVAVDQYYYSTICQELSKLKGEDYSRTKVLFATRVGLQNIEIILRAKTFKTQPGIIKKWLIATKFCPLRSNIHEKLINSQNLEETFHIIRDETPFHTLASRLLMNLEEGLAPLENFDNYADQEIVHKANSIFRGASFNLSIFPAFFILKEIELRNLRTLILGVINKRSIKEILDKIVLV